MDFLDLFFLKTTVAEMGQTQRTRDTYNNYAIFVNFNSNINVYNFNKKWDKIIKNNNFAFLCFYRVGSLSTFIVKMVSEEKTLNVNQNCGYKKLCYIHTTKCISSPKSFNISIWISAYCNETRTSNCYNLLL